MTDTRDGFSRLALTSDIPLRDGSKDLSYPSNGDKWGNGRFEGGVLCIGSSATGTPLGCTGAVRIEGVAGNGVDYVRIPSRPGHGILIATLSAAGAPDVEAKIVNWTSAPGLRQFIVEGAVPGADAYAGGTLTIADVAWGIVRVAGPYIAVEGDALLPYVLVDDDAVRMPADLHRSQYMAGESDRPDENVYAQAYVRIAYDLVSDTVPEFKRNVSVGDGNEAAKAQLAAGRPPSAGDLPGFWEAYVQFGYQAGAKEDADPDGSGLVSERNVAPRISGIAPDLVPTWGSLIFTEVSRDNHKWEFDECDVAMALSHVIAHEVTHQFGATHPRDRQEIGGIMDSSCLSDYEMFLNEATRAKVRER